MAINAPTDITGCVLWLDTGSLSALVDGDAVTSWADSSGQNNNASSSGTAPTYRDGSDFNHGKPGVKYINETDRLLVGASASLDNTTATYVAVHATDLEDLSGTETHHILNKQNTNPLTFGLTQNIEEFGRAQACCRLDGAEGTIEVAQDAGWVDQSVLIHVIRYDGSTLEHFINGDLAASTNVSGLLDVDNSGPLAVGNHPSASRAAEGVLYDVIAYNDALTNAEIDDVVAWARDKYPVNFIRQGELFTDGLRGVSTFVDGATGYLAYVQSDGVTVGYKTAPQSDPHNWTDQGAIFTAPVSTRGICLRFHNSEWLLYYDDRLNGGIRLARGSTLGSLADVAGNPILTGTGVSGDDNQFLRHPEVLTPSDNSHDGAWHLLVDGRQNTATNAYGAVFHYSGTGAESWSSPEKIIDKSSASGEYDRTDAGAPGVIYDGTEYLIAFAGFNDSYRNTLEVFGYPHHIGIAKSTDLTAVNTTKSTDNPQGVWGFTSTSFDNAAQGQPTWYTSGNGERHIYYVGHEFVGASSVNYQIGYMTDASTLSAGPSPTAQNIYTGAPTIASPTLAVTQGTVTMAAKDATGADIPDQTGVLAWVYSNRAQAPDAVLTNQSISGGQLVLDVSGLTDGTAVYVIAELSNGDIGVDDSSVVYQ